jgi:nicotinate-nucleotide adenylyltransferase
VAGGRIGLLGGSFNPVHWAHLRAAEEVREACRLDQVRFVLAATPPHKTSIDLAPVADRLRMLELAVAGNPALRVSAVEVERGGTSYSIDTIRQVLAEDPPPAALTLIVGHDTFRDLHTWKQHGEIFTHCDIAVVSRPGHSGPLSIDDFPVAARQRFCYDPLRDCFRHDSGHTVSFVPIVPLAISATEIRRQVRARLSIRYLVPESVERYIHERGLYQRASSASGEAP